MWVVIEDDDLVREKKYQKIVNLENGNRFYVNTVSNQHELDTNLRVWGNWTTHGTLKLFTGSESECADFIASIAKRLGALSVPGVDISKGNQGIC